MNNPVRILYLEDNPRDAELVRDCLQQADIVCELRIASNRAQYEAALTQTRFDLILSDYSLPDFDGMAALALARERQPGIPFIIISGTIGEDTAVAAIKAGAHDYLMKDKLARLGPAIVRELHEAQLRRERRQIETYLVRNYETQAALNALLSLSMGGGTTAEFLDRALDLVLSLRWLAFESRGAIFLADEAQKTLDLQAQRGFSKDLCALCSTVPFGLCLCGKAAESRTIQFADCLDARHDTRYAGMLPHGHYCVPILSGDHVLRVLNLYVKEGHTRDLSEEEFLTSVANTLAGAIERKQAELALEENARLLNASQQLVKGILNAIPVRVFWKDKNLVYLGCNTIFAHDAGFADPQEIIGKDDFQMGWREQAEKYRTDDRQVIESGVANLLIEESQTTPEGNTITLLSSKVPLRDQQGKIIGILGTYMDITAHKQTEAALQESEIRHRTFIDATSDMAFLKDESFRYLISNRANSAFMGQSEVAVIGHTDFDFMPVEVATHCRASDRKTMEKGAGVTTEEVVNSRTYQTTKFPVPLVGGRVGVGGYIRDITEHVQAETALKNAHQALQRALLELQANQAQMLQQERLSALGQLASGIAHDFNNALTPILGYSDLLLSRPELLANREKALGFITRISKAAEDGKKVVSRLRLIHQPDQLETFMPVDLAEVARDAILLTASRWDTELGTQGIRIRVETKIAPPMLVLGDAAQLREALMNLILNAADAMPLGGIIIFSAMVEAGDVVLSVTDTGIGMSVEVKAHCLEAFYTTKGVKGSGLGLAMVAGIVHRHKGKLEIDSAPGHGTTFRLRLPGVGTGEPAAKTASEKATTKTPVSALRVLLAEDESVIRDLLEDYLKIDGHAVETAQDGREALAKVSTGAFDLVITDRAMPGANGDEVAHAAKARNPAPPVILLTGFGDLMHDAGECPPGVDLVLGKPVTIENLQSAIRKVMVQNVPS